MTQPIHQISPQLHNPTSFSTAPAVQRTGTKPPSDADIAERAYAKYELRGRVDGFDQEDWRAATRELIAEASGHFSSPHSSPAR